MGHSTSLSKLKEAQLIANTTITTFGKPVPLDVSLPFAFYPFPHRSYQSWKASSVQRALR